MIEMPRYFNYNYNDCKYYEVSGPCHDHYTYKYETNYWYEDIIEEKTIELNKLNLEEMEEIELNGAD